MVYFTCYRSIFYATVQLFLTLKFLQVKCKKMIWLFYEKKIGCVFDMNRFCYFMREIDLCQLVKNVCYFLKRSVIRIISVEYLWFLLYQLTNYIIFYKYEAK